MSPVSPAHGFSFHFLEPNDYHLLSRSCHTIRNRRFLRTLMAGEWIYDSPACTEKQGNSYCAKGSSHGALPRLRKRTGIQIFIWTQDVDRSIERNKSSLWCSCQNWLKPESVYRRPKIFQQFFLQTSTLRLITLPIWVNGKPYSHLSPLVPHYFSIYDDWGQGRGTKEEVIKHEWSNFLFIQMWWPQNK